MGHNLEIDTNGKASMFYYGDEPWHGYGTKVNSALTADEALKEARLDFEVVKKPIYLADGSEIDSKFATCRTDRDGADSVLGVVGDRYTVIQNSDMLSVFDGVVARNEAIYHTAGVLGKGERVWLMAKLPDSIQATAQDILDKYILLTNSHDGTNSAIVKIIINRVVCENTLNSALYYDKGRSVNIRHTATFQEKLDQAQHILGIAQNYFKSIEQQIQKLAVTEITDNQLLAYVNSLLDITLEKQASNEVSTRAINKRDKILELAEVGKGSEWTKGTMWGAVNAVTEYVDHYSSIKNGKYLDSVWFGNGSNFKNKAFDLAIKLSNN